MRRDDEAGAIRLANARELATGRERAVKLAGVEAECARATADLDTAETTLQALDHEIAALMPAPPPKGRDPLSFLDAWRARREEAMAIIAMHRESKEAARRANEGAMRACRTLSDALRAAGAPHAAEGALEPLIEAAEAAIAEQEKAESLHQKARDRRAEVVRAEGRLKGALDDDARWRGAWREACAGSWLGDAEAEPPLNAVRQAQKALEDLRAALKDCAELDHRITAMEHDKQLFTANVGEIGQALGIDERAGDAARLADAIEARVARAREEERRRRDKTKALAAARGTLGAIVEAVAVNARLGSAMTDFFGVDSLAEVAARLDDCRRRDALCDDIARETGAILALNIANAFDPARAALEMASRTALDEELGVLKTREADDEAASRENFAAYREALRRLEAVGGDDAVARIEEKRRTILEEIKDGARRYLTLRAGLTAADEALRLYRERHRGAMMERASKAFFGN